MIQNLFNKEFLGKDKRDEGKKQGYCQKFFSHPGTVNVKHSSALFRLTQNLTQASFLPNLVWLPTKKLQDRLKGKRNTI